MEVQGTGVAGGAIDDLSLQLEHAVGALQNGDLAGGRGEVGDVVVGGGEMVQVDGLAANLGGDMEVLAGGGEGVLAGIQIDIGTVAQHHGSIGDDLLTGDLHIDHIGVHLAEIDIGMVTGVVDDGDGLVGQQLDLTDGQVGIVVTGQNIIDVDDDVGDGGAGALIEQTQVAVSQLGDAVVGVVLVLIGDDVVIVGQGHGVVFLDQEHIQVAVLTVVGVGGTGDQNGLLSVDLLGVEDGGQLVVGTLGGFGGNLGGGHNIVLLLLGPDIIGVVQGAGPVTVEHADGAILQNNSGGLGGLVAVVVGGILRAEPVALGVHPDQAGALVAAGVLVGSEDHAVVDLVIGAVAGADQQSLLGLLLQVQQGGLGPVQTIGGGGQVQEVGGVGLVGGIGEEQVGVDAVAGDVEESINGVALDGSAVSLV